MSKDQATASIRKLAGMALNEDELEGYLKFRFLEDEIPLESEEALFEDFVYFISHKEYSCSGCTGMTVPSKP